MGHTWRPLVKPLRTQPQGTHYSGPGEFARLRETWLEGADESWVDWAMSGDDETEEDAPCP